MAKFVFFASLKPANLLFATSQSPIWWLEDTSIWRMRSLEAGKPCSQAWQRIPSDPNEMECVNVRSLKHRRLNFELQKAEEIGSHIAHENSKIQKIPLLWFRMILPILPSVEVSILYVESNFRHPWLRGKTKKEMCVQLNKTRRTCHRWPKKWVTGVKTKTL